MNVKRNPANERAKRAYLQWLGGSQGRDQASLDAVAKALERFDEYNRRRDFAKFHFEQALGFKARLCEQSNARTGAPLSASTIKSTLAALKAFFIWLSGEPTYRAKLRRNDAAFFNPTDNLARVAGAHRRRPFPSLDQIRAALAAMPMETEIDRRDRALVAFAILTGARDAAIVSARLKHIDIEGRLLEQDAREMATKKAKTFTTWFYPVGDDIEKIVVEWVEFLRGPKQFGPEDPIFPKTRVTQGPEMEFAAASLDRAPWANANAVRKLFRLAFARAGLPYFNPHSFRNTLVQLAYESKLNAEQIKAWSQNLGHEHIVTTLVSYGTVQPFRQAEIFADLAKPKAATKEKDVAEILREALAKVEQQKQTG
jgi:integrase